MRKHFVEKLHEETFCGEKFFEETLYDETFCGGNIL